MSSGSSAGGPKRPPASPSQAGGRPGEDTPVHAIGVVADRLGVSVQVVRRYDTPGLVQPERTDGGQRRYSRRDIAQLKHVVELAAEGIPISGIRRILDLERQLRAARGQGPPH